MLFTVTSNEDATDERWVVYTEGAEAISVATLDEVPKAIRLLQPAAIANDVPKLGEH